MKALHALYLFVSVFAVGSVMTQHLDASSWGKESSSRNTTASPDQTAPAMPESMISKQNPMHSLGDTSNDGDESSSQSIVELISSDPSFSTLLAALKAADLINVLSDEGPYTFFAPNDAAFAKLSPNALSDLLKPENKEKLVGILTYHVVPGQLASDQLKTGKVKTLQGKPLNVQVKDQDITVNNAKVIKSDVSASNGVIYAVDTVLIP
jgi:uncharacterized surface protein with fasciclin (FAS1) repeats